ncbi:hypothetical protein GDN83_17650 [Gordonia jinghuaiqii]|uniref:HTH luxR-type domain-containing protein n=1 Tax=Gordonia jinghuaiqii TaxID=2758710 RepID=A0A7D7QVQ1_9ACTN|nr:LuxR C-terminal-related transcriptional regulator [Gordonia jinghuaiqii]MCR5979537.1 hypothetical protein [Gordonia jinghuaiqii]QMT00669.1 hypothetical protein H1R19_17490 [Gordonia jinghuaiqii]
MGQRPAGRSSRSRTPLTSLVGRSEQIDEVISAFNDARLVSLVGVGGIGKSRLAAAVAAESEPHLADGVAVIELGAVTDPRHLPQLVREAIAPTSNQQVSLEDLLSRREMLMVLDGCEHLIPDVAEFTAEILECTPGLRVLATSRLPLSIPGEHLFHVPGLRVADVGAERPSESAELFRSRARAVTGQTSLGSLPIVEELCRRLDGLPLAIELAAIRTRTMSVEELLAGINNRFALLRASSQGTEPRSIDAVLRWSWEQCTPDEQQLWAEFSIFVGAIPLGSITDVCGFSDTLATADIIDGLVQRSLLVRQDTPRGVTFRMLDTIAAFGAQMLAATPDRAVELRARHARHYASIAAGISDSWFGPEQQRKSELLRTHIPNFRAAYNYCLPHAELADTAVSMFADLWTYWVASGQLREARVWAGQLVAAAPPEHERALWVAGWVELLLGDLDTAEIHLDVCRRNSAPTTRANYLSDSLLAACRAIRGDFDFAADRYRAAIAQATAADDTFAVTLLTQNHAELATISGDVTGGLASCADVEAICERHNERWIYSHTLWVEALGALMQDRYDDAITHASSSLELKSSIHDLLGTALVAETLAWASALRADLHTAAVILGATSAYWQGTDTPLLGFAQLQKLHARCLDLLDRGLDPDSRVRAESDGARIGLEGLAGLMDTGGDLRAASTRPAARIAQLTRREREIAELVRIGLSNRQIAHRLYISVRTVETHVSHILAKLGLSRRGEIEATLDESGPERL